jgi:imidazolonepropionase-like amidohydrolase
LAHRFPALIAAPAAAQGRIWLTGARLFDGTGSRLRENAAILIEDGIIRRVADAAGPCPDGAWPLEVGQRVLMPGLTDAHTHASGTVPRVAKGAEEPLPGIAAHFLQADFIKVMTTGARSNADFRSGKSAPPCRSAPVAGLRCYGVCRRGCTQSGA